MSNLGTLQAGMLLTKACNCYRPVILQHMKFTPRILTHSIDKRYRKRTCKPPVWFVPKRTKNPLLLEKEITAENKDFLKEEFEDRFVGNLPVKNSPLKDGPWARNEWTTSTQRCGVLGIKIGVIPQWTKRGKKIYTTLIQVLDNHVIKYTPPEEYKNSEAFKPHFEGLGSQVVGALSCSPHLFTKNYNGLFAEAGVPPKRKLTRFLITPEAAIEPGTPLKVNHFRVGDYVDIQAKTIGHGFQGVVKRWGFKGGPASHGSTKFRRRPGSIGGGGDKAAVWKGKKMPGHMGMDWVTQRGNKIWKMDTKYNILYVHGACLPGPSHCYVRVMDTSLSYRRDQLAQEDSGPPMPTFYPDDALEPIPEEIYDEQLFEFTEPSITYDEVKN